MFSGFVEHCRFVEEVVAQVDLYGINGSYGNPEAFQQANLHPNLARSYFTGISFFLYLTVLPASSVQTQSFRGQLHDQLLPRQYITGHTSF